MAPKVVDKNEKRREIALSCHELIHDKGIRKITIAQVAKMAGIGKGTVYEYFENKDDIVFEIINMHIEQYHNHFLETIKDVTNTKEKVYHFFKFVLDDSEENMKHFNGFKDYLSIMLAEENEAMSEYNCDCHSFFEEQMQKIIQDGIDSKELIPEALAMSHGLLIFEKGLVLLKMTQKDFDVKTECEKFINNFFKLIEIKK
ncbi:MAG: TetR/AcrR family transcriptional regulator [Campylobacteraceae bacterium]|nr:TetR/AcrR family transcriptional regulator [Campylobacteraceae bacterium]